MKKSFIAIGAFAMIISLSACGNGASPSESSSRGTAASSTGSSGDIGLTGYEVYDACSDGLCAVEKDGLWGYIDESKKLVVPCTYNDRGRFVNGVGPVKKDGYWGVIDKQNKAVVDFQFDSVTLVNKLAMGDDDTKLPVASFTENGLLGVVINGAGGVIDKSGDYVVPLNKAFLSATFYGNYIGMSSSSSDLGDIYTSDGKLLKNNATIQYLIEDGSLLINENGNYEIVDSNGNITTDLTAKAKQNGCDWDYGVTIMSLERYGVQGEWSDWLEIDYGKARDQQRMSDNLFLNYISLKDGSLISANFFKHSAGTSHFQTEVWFDVLTTVDDESSRTFIYKNDGSLLKTLDGCYRYWNGFYFDEDTDESSQSDGFGDETDGQGKTLYDLNNPAIKFEFSSFSPVDDQNNPITFKTAIVGDKDGIFQGLFVDQKLAYDAAYNSVTYDQSTKSFFLAKGNAQTRVKVDENGKTTEEAVS